LSRTAAHAIATAKPPRLSPIVAEENPLRLMMKITAATLSAPNITSTALTTFDGFTYDSHDEENAQTVP
jgi:hypothetical protein